MVVGIRDCMGAGAGEVVEVGRNVTASNQATA
jgi:hypothetical protein